MKNTDKILCDGCSKDISDGRFDDWRIAVINDIAPRDGAPTEFPPLLMKNAHLCSIKCLKKWAAIQHEG